MRGTLAIWVALALASPTLAHAADLSLHDGKTDFTASAKAIDGDGAGVNANAALKIALPGVVTKFEGTAQSQRHDTAMAGSDAQDSATLRVSADVSHGSTQATLTAADALDIHTHDGASGDALYSTHSVQQNRTKSTNAQITITPLPALTLSASTQESQTDTQQSQWFTGAISKSEVASTIARDQASASYHPTANVDVTAKAALSVGDLRMQNGTVAQAAWQAVEPDVTATVHPTSTTTFSVGAGQQVAPITPANLAAWRAASGETAITSLKPDSSTDFHANLSSKAGPLTLAASYTAATLNSTTVLGQGPNGQIPQSIAGGSQQTVSADVQLALTPLGIDNTSLSSHAVWRDSSIHDPVTGADHALSGEVPHEAEIKFSHALPAAHVNFGLDAKIGATSTFYQVAEQTQIRSDPSLGAYLHYAPGPFAIDLTVDGLGGGATRTDMLYAGTRNGSLDHVTQSEIGGPSIGISFSKPLNG